MVKKIFFLLLIVCLSKANGNNVYYDNYIVAIRIKTSLESNPLLYTDHPKSYLMRSIKESCEKYIESYEVGEFYRLRNQAKKIIEFIELYGEFSYPSSRDNQKENNVRKFYFSVSSESRD